MLKQPCFCKHSLWLYISLRLTSCRFHSVLFTWSTCLNDCNSRYEGMQVFTGVSVPLEGHHLLGHKPGLPIKWIVLYKAIVSQLIQVKHCVIKFFSKKKRFVHYKCDHLLLIVDKKPLLPLSLLPRFDTHVLSFLRVEAYHTISMYGQVWSHTSQRIRLITPSCYFSLSAWFSDTYKLHLFNSWDEGYQ